MNKLELKEATKDYVIYLYRPEGKGTFGEIRMNYDDDEAFVISCSDEDKFGRYAFKATKAVKECVKERNLPIDFIQAWH